MKNVGKLIGSLIAFAMIWGMAGREALGTEITVIQGVITAEPAGSGGCVTNPVLKKSFSDQDQRVGLWVQTDGTYEGQTILSEFYDPQGNLYSQFRHEIQIGQKLLNACAWIPIAGARAAQLPGQWTAKFSVNGVVRFQDTFTISATPPPGHRPVITRIDFPTTLKRGQPTQGKIFFEDLDGDITQSSAEFVNVSGVPITGDLTPPPWDPGIFGQTSGSFTFTLTCADYDRTTTWIVRFRLTDSTGLISDPFEVRYDCVVGGTPPRIVRIDFPTQLPADETKVYGKLYFEDPEGDIVKLSLAPVSGPLNSNQWDPEIRGTTSGSLQFWIACNGNLGKTIVARFTLTDSSGLVSNPYDITYTCVSSPPPPPPPSNDACGYSLGSDIYNKWVSLGGRSGFLGCPIMNEAEAGVSPQGTSGRWAEFSGGNGGFVIWHRTGRLANTSFEVHGLIFRLYKSLGGTASWLGFPISDEYDVPGGRRSDFEGGYIVWNAQTGETKAFQYDVAPPTGGNPWDTPMGQNCFEQWIGVAMSKLNAYNGSKSFNDNKPYSINKYGILEGRSFRSVAAPDNFRDYNNNKYWYMWDYWNGWSSITGWSDQGATQFWDAAGVPPLRGFVEDCIKQQGGTPPSPPPPPPPTGGNPWETPVGQNCFERWISEAMSKVNVYNGSKSFNDNKPYSINKYGILEGRSFRSVFAPDNFRDYNNNKYWYMWDYWNGWGPVTGWPDQGATQFWDAAGVPSLRNFVNDCVAQQGGGGTPALRRFDSNNNDRIDDLEMIAILNAWRAGSFDELAILQALDAWIRQRPISSIPASAELLSLGAIALTARAA